MPKKKPRSKQIQKHTLLKKELSDKANADLKVAIQSSQSISLLSYTDPDSPSSYFARIGFQVYERLDDLAFQRVHIPWIPPFTGDTVLTQQYALPNQDYVALQNALAPVQPVMTPVPATLLPYAANQFKQVSRYAHEKFRPSCPRNLFASRD